MSILVTCATGKQGAPTVRHLLAANSGRTIKALVRDPSSDRAKALAAQGAELVQGDLSDHTSVEAALKQVDSAFLVTPFNGTSYRPHDEIRDARAFIDMAKATGIKHIVFASVGGAEQESDVPHFDSKMRIEEYLAASGLDYTVLRPTGFMENFEKDTKSLGFWATALQGRVSQFIACDDIGRVAAITLLNQQEYSKKVLPLAAEDLNVEQMADAFESVRGGQRPDTTPVPTQALEGVPEDMQRMFKFLRERGFCYDLEALKKQTPGKHLSFKEWLKV